MMSPSQTVASVFCVEPLRIGGVEMYAREMSRQLGEKGWESVLCFLSPPQESIRRFLALPNVRLEVFDSETWFSCQGVRQMVRLLRTHRPSVLHLQFTKFSGPYPWLGKLVGVKKVFFTDQVSRPEAEAAGRRPIWKRALVRMANAPVSRVFCVSEFNRQYLAVQGGVRQDRLQCLYNGVDLSRVAEGVRQGRQFRQRYCIPPDSIVVMQVSWMISEKGVGDLLQAAKLILQNSREFHFVLVGEGSQRQEYEDMAARLGIASHVTFTGRLHAPIVEGAYAATDILCQVSRWQEAFGWVIAEAMAFSKPVVATRVGGIPEVVADGRSGWLVERGDVGAIAERILVLGTKPELRTSFGQAGRQICEELFDLRKNVASLVRLYLDQP